MSAEPLHNRVPSLVIHKDFVDPLADMPWGQGSRVHTFSTGQTAIFTNRIQREGCVTSVTCLPKEIPVISHQISDLSPIMKIYQTQTEGFSAKSSSVKVTKVKEN